MKCPECAEEIKDEAIKCRFCGNKITKKGSSNRLLFLIIIMVLIFVYNNEKSKSSMPAYTPTSGDTSSYMVGKKGILQAAYVGTTKEADDALTEALISKDTIGVAKLLQSGLVYNIKEDTEVLVLEQGIVMKKARLLEGPYYGETVWVPTEFIRIE